MSNNRLYVGNKKSKKWLMLCKGWGEGWDGLNGKKIKMFNKFIMSEDCIGESDFSPTSLFFFTEQDRMECNTVFCGPDWEEFTEKDW